MVSSTTAVGRPLVLLFVLLVVAAGGALAHGGDHGGAPESSSTPVTDAGWAPAVVGLFALVALPAVPAVWLSGYWDPARRLDYRHATAAGLALFSAAVHLFLFVRYGDAVMLLAGLGFVGGVLLFASGAVPHRPLYLAGVLYAAVQIVLWVAAGLPHFATFGLLDKVVQGALVGFLWRLRRAEAKPTSAEATGDGRAVE